jgi:GT2 family glycosyltransferase
MIPAAASRHSRLPDALSGAAEETIRGIAIVILTWNQLNQTRRCLCSLARAGYALDRIVLWDNGSEDGTEESITRDFPDVIYHRHPTNLGVASGRNAAALFAIRQLSPTHLLFLDNDMVVTPGFVECLGEPFISEPWMAQTLAKIRFLDAPDRLHSAGGIFINFSQGTMTTVGYGESDQGQYDVSTPCLPSGGATMVSVSAFQELGGFDPTFDLYGTEDIDFAFNARAAGYKAQYIPEAVVYHDWQNDRSRLYLQRSDFATTVQRWMILLGRHATWQQKMGFYLWGAPKVLFRVLVKELRRGNAAALRGIADGLSDFLRQATRGRKPRRSAYEAGLKTD